ncbi:hypothetical protein IE331_01815 [Nocardioides sp. MJB4]|uniref:Uncharacterized protein n=1 Tax=Nocardioides donggukensis TaxID=2774019 RepID=A0A927K1B3_9ACTN|nr:hypothetical protein [Nocardioides donggukensis]
MVKAVVVPSAPLLLAEYAAAGDPAPALTAACTGAVEWLVQRRPPLVHVLTSPPTGEERANGAPDLGPRVAEHLLRRAGFAGEVVAGARPGEQVETVLVVADGSARRGEKAPGHLDERSFAFDAAVEEALMLADSAALESLDVRLGAELLARGVPALQALGALDLPVEQVDLDYAGDPFGVQYWVVRWQCVL